MIGVPIYKVLHLKTKQEIYVNPGELIRWNHLRII
jgi:hypothetical protein